MKYIVDLVLIIICLPLLIPLFMVVAILVWFNLSSPIFFFQTRPGITGKPFEMVKFRSMNDLRNTDGTLAADSQRLTRFGHFLRSSSLDELPELWNVLKGDMSLVGPRPLLLEYLERYTSEQALRHSVKPGITGWAQVNGRNAISWEDKFKLDVWYVNHQSFWLDIKILFLTIKKVFFKEGISQQGHATMPVYMGTQAKTEEKDSQDN